MSNACPADSHPLVHQISNKPMSCSPEFANCPVNFDCTFNQMFDQNYCCSSWFSRCSFNKPILGNQSNCMKFPLLVFITSIIYFQLK